MVLGEVLVCFRFDVIYLYSDISVYFEDGPPVGFAVPVLKSDLVEAELRGDGEVAQDDVEALVGEGSRKGVALLPISTLNVSRAKGVTAIPLEPKAGMPVVLAYRKDHQPNPYLDALIAKAKERSKSIPAL